MTSEEVRPRRVQLSRKKGWKMPPNTVSVARLGKWGNPHVVGERGVRTRALASVPPSGDPQ